MLVEWPSRNYMYQKKLWSLFTLNLLFTWYDNQEHLWEQFLCYFGAVGCKLLFLVEVNLLNKFNHLSEGN